MCQWAENLNTVLVVGLGDVGAHLLEISACAPSLAKTCVTDKNEELSRAKIYGAVGGAIHRGFCPIVDFVSLDIMDVDACAKRLEEIEPDVIVSAAAVNPRRPLYAHEELSEAGFAPWLPLHFTPVFKLMKAITKARLKTHVINCSFPDAVNCILDKLDMAPTVGAGNCDLFIPQLRSFVANRFRVSVGDVTIYFVGHHSLIHALGADRETLGCPYYLKILVNDKDVTSLFDTGRLLVESTKYMPKGHDNRFLVASSVFKNMLCILGDTKELTYAPGVEGLPGGYPTRLSREGARIDLPDGLTRREAIGINEESQKLDGIERIESDGTAVFTKRTAEIIKRVLGYECNEFRPEESEEQARELLLACDRFTA